MNGIELGIGLLVPLLLLAGCSHHPASTPRSPAVLRSTYAVDGRHGWRLEVHQDGFSQEIECRLQSRDGKSIYRAGSVGFHFGRKRDVSQAVYRLDGGAPHAQRDDLPRLV